MNSRVVSTDVDTLADRNRRRALAMLPDGAAPERDDTTIVLWMFRDYDNRWCVRQEGGNNDAVFLSREKALAFARETGQAWGSYRLFIELRDGRVTQELLNLAHR
jgi:hypothetical protein